MPNANQSQTGQVPQASRSADTDSINRKPQLFFTYLKNPAIEVSNLSKQPQWWKDWFAELLKSARAKKPVEGLFDEMFEKLSLCRNLRVDIVGHAAVLNKVNSNLESLLRLVHDDSATEEAQQLAHALQTDVQLTRFNEFLELLKRPTTVQAISGPLCDYLNTQEVKDEIGSENLKKFKDVFQNYDNKVSNEMAIARNASSHTWEGRLGKLIAETGLLFLNLLIVALGGDPKFDLNANQNNNMPRYMPGIKAS